LMRAPAARPFRIGTEAPKLLPAAFRIGTEAPKLLSAAFRISTEGPKLLSAAFRIGTEGPKLLSAAFRISTEGPKHLSAAFRISTEGPKFLFWAFRADTCYIVSLFTVHYPRSEWKIPPLWRGILSQPISGLLLLTTLYSLSTVHYSLFKVGAENSPPQEGNFPKAHSRRR
jgi:hypothetical protein